ncbi:antitoxin protein of toxin-antitoxin system [Mumia flava]|uniref:Antitoxin protein of toxin-antitoxin system n=1 Tax=Mumia flava TaxID=1348852 RepID=A0A0B2B6N4_9ACTN|nr:antitoxin [Mumia flava]PJJ56168.1 antitoxin protein of toxin-antitoxin system [Mumia flava]
MSRFDEYLGKAKVTAKDLRSKAGTMVNQNEAKIDGVMEKAKAKAKDVTKGKYDAKIDKAHDAARSGVRKIGEGGSGGEPPTSPPSGPAGPSGPGAR